MVFSSTIFLFLFLPACLLGYYLIRTDFRNVFLLIMSILFYAWGEPKFVFILICSVFLNYLLAIAIDKYPRCAKLFLCLAIFVNMGILFIFKYLVFVLENINSFTKTNLPIPNIVLPIGISFFTFQALSYVLDVYFGTSKVQKNIGNLALYITFFPQLIAGPIVRYNSVEQQITTRKIDSELFIDGIKRFVIGLSKKIILSNLNALIVDKALSGQAGEMAALTTWLGIVCYCLQLYYDFSGYSDMAIGLGKMFGFTFEENFNYPYISKSIGEYWRRWHISLSIWLRDYLYTPVFRSLLGKKIPLIHIEIKSMSGDILALLVTWIFAGIWHGANWNFIWYGVYYFFFIALEHVWDTYKKRRAKRLKLPKKNPTKFGCIFMHIKTILIILFGQLLFMVPNMTKFKEYIGSMFCIYGNDFINDNTKYIFNENMMVLLFSILFCMPVIKWIKSFLNRNKSFEMVCYLMEPFLYIGLFIVAIAYTVTSTYNPFIYFNF